MSELKNNSKESYALELELMRFYQEEFLHRHQLFWKLIVEVTAVVAVIALFPFVVSAFGITLEDMGFLWEQTIYGVPIACLFPIAGLVFSFVGAILLNSEAKRMSAVNKTKMEINGKLPKGLQYIRFDLGNGKKAKKNAKSMSIPVIWVSLLGNVLICIASFVLCILCNNSSIQPN